MLFQVSNSPANLLANTFFSNTSAGLWIISGPSGTGKTKLCAEVIAQATGRGLKVGGILCPAVYKNWTKIGINQIDITSGKCRRLATRSYDANNSTIGCWQMDEDVVAWGNQILNGLKDEDMIVIDEIGPLEFEKGFGYHEALRLLDEGRYRTILIVVRPTLLALACSRWPQARALKLGREGA
jgi:nucleoside-triphosphatase